MFNMTHFGWTQLYPTAADYENKRQWIRGRLYDRFTMKLKALQTGS